MGQMVIDTLRVIEICLIILSIGFLLGWVIHYWQLYGFPRPVWLLIGSYILYATGTMLEIQLRLGTPATWRTIIAGAAAVTGVIAQGWAYLRWGSAPNLRKREPK